MTHREQIHDKLTETINDIFDDDNAEIHTEQHRDTENIGGRDGTVATKQGNTVLEAKLIGTDPPIMATIEIEYDDKRTIIHGDSGSSMDPPEHVYADPNDNPEPDCPMCGKSFSQDDWERTGTAAGDYGGSVYYDCPTDDCDGHATFLF